MLFNSFVFIFGFLPLTLMLCAFVNGRRLAFKWIVTVLSLAFYAWWNPIYLPLLLFSIVFNYLIGVQLERSINDTRMTAAKNWLSLGVGVDLFLLGYFKYSNFLLDIGNQIFGTDIRRGHISLPLAISFFTFQKIAYLIDIQRGDAKKTNFDDFVLFAAFFPQLIAGPIVHYSEIIPQFRKRLFGLLRSKNLMVGLVIFAIGLFKKTVIADTLAPAVAGLFDIDDSEPIGFVSGWMAAITFTLQVYFDFSGYSDMAIGLARLFGIQLPLNFHSPLRATSIIEYWRRWHMTLQRFIVSYIFQPLSLPLNRYVAERRLKSWPAFLVGIAAPTFVTFVAVGIWHGAGWTFVLFGALHAIYICCNEAWREFQTKRRKALRKRQIVARPPGPMTIFAYRCLTLAAVAFGNVLFRAQNVGDALAIWSGMLALNGLRWSDSAVIAGDLLYYVAIGVALISFFPNTQQLMRRYRPAINSAEWTPISEPLIQLTWRPNAAGLIFAAVALVLGVLFIQRGQAVFLYFNF